MRVMVLVKATEESGKGFFPTPEAKAAMVEMGKFNNELRKAGILRTADGLTPSSRGKRERSTACEIAVDTGSPEPLTPGEKMSLVFSLTPGPVRLRPGNTLCFDVASRADLLKSDVSHGYVHFDIPAPPYFSRNTLHYGPDSYVELWRIGR